MGSNILLHRTNFENVLLPMVYVFKSVYLNTSYEKVNFRNECLLLLEKVS